MKITKFGREEHRLLSQAVTRALKEVGDTFGVDLTASGGQIGAGVGRIHLSVRVRETENGKNGAAAEWDRVCHVLGLPAGLCGKTFIQKGIIYEITGLQLNRPKFPVSAERVHDGAAFKFPASSIKLNFPSKAAA